MVILEHRQEFDEIRLREQKWINERGDFLSRTFCLAASLQITRLLLHLHMRENSAMFLMWVIGIIGAFVLSFGGWWLPLGFSLLFLHYIVDYCDGQLARQHKSSSLVAAVRDRWIHFTVQAGTFLALGFYIWEHHESAVHLIAPALCYIWFQFRILIANLPISIYCSEFAGYPPPERAIIRQNHKQTMAGAGQPSGAVPKSNTEKLKSSNKRPRCLRTEFRSIAINFDGFNLLMVPLAVLGLILEGYVLAGIQANFDPVLVLLWLWVAFYSLNAIDYTITYLFSTRIDQDISALDQKFDHNPDA